MSVTNEGEEGGKMSIFCWHHGEIKRLQHYLCQGMVDCPGDYFLAKHKLKPGDKIRFSVKVRNKACGQIFACAELVSETPQYLREPRSKAFPYGVNLKNIEHLDGTKLCKKYPAKGMSRSHWVQETRPSGNIAAKMANAGLI